MQEDPGSIPDSGKDLCLISCVVVVVLVAVVAVVVGLLFLNILFVTNFCNSFCNVHLVFFVHCKVTKYMGIQIQT